MRVTFEEVKRSEWERIFGSEEARQKSFRAAIEAKKCQQMKKSYEQPLPMAVHGENKGAGRRLYGSPHKGIWDEGLGQRTYGRSDRARKLEAAGLVSSR